MKRCNYASITAVFPDGSRVEWTTKPTAPFAQDVALFADWLIDTAGQIRSSLNVKADKVLNAKA